MADIWYDVDSALAEVPVNILPLLDATDFKTIEDAVAYNAGGLALNWHFVTTAGAYTVTAVTPTTAGDYDWTDQGTAGIYTIEIPASGGASINNDTEGFGWFTGVATGVLPWRGPVCGFRAAALNNSMIDGTTIDVNVTAMAAGTVTASAIADNAIDLATFAADAKALMGVIAFGTAQSVTGTTIRLASAETFADDEIIGATVIIRSASTGAGQARVITDYASATDTATVDTWTTTPTGTITYIVIATAPSSATAPITANVTQWAGSAVATPSVAGVPEVDLTHVAGATTNVAALATNVDAILTDTAAMTTTGVTLANGAQGGAAATLTLKRLIVANTTNGETAVDISASGTGNAHALNVIATGGGKGVAIGAASVGLSVDSSTADAVQIQGGTNSDGLQISGNGSGVDIRADITGDLTGNVSGSVGSVTGLTAADVAAIKAKTDSLTFTQAGHVDSNVQRINDVIINGAGTIGNEFAP